MIILLIQTKAGLLYFYAIAFVQEIVLLYICTNGTLINDLFWENGKLEKQVHSFSENTPINYFLYTYATPPEILFDMHYEIEVGIVYEGKMERRYEKQKKIYSQGDIWLCSMWEPHGYRITETPCTVGIFIVSHPFLSQLSTV